MDAALQQLYQELILDHNKRPRNFGPLTEATHRADGHNPMCGDQLTVRLQLVDARIQKVRCEAEGCAISRASASMMGAAMEGRDVAAARALFAAFHALLTQAPDGPSHDETEDDPAMLKLQALAGVRAFPMRVKCATLAWHTLISALGEQTSVSTEADADTAL